jgi:hypothetical protein
MSDNFRCRPVTSIEARQKSLARGKRVNQALHRLCYF